MGSWLCLNPAHLKTTPYVSLTVPSLSQQCRGAHVVFFVSLFVSLFIYICVNTFIHTFIPSFIHSYSRSFIHSFIFKPFFFLVGYRFFVLQNLFKPSLF